MSVNYDYTIQTAFPNQKVDCDLLMEQVKATALVEVFEYLGTADGVCSLYFSRYLTTEEQTTLNGIVAAHQGFRVVPTFLVTASLVGSEVAIESSDWSTLAGITTNADFFCPVAQSWGEVLGSAKMSGTGAQLRLIEEGTVEEGGDAVLAGPHALTEGDWQVTRFNSTGNTPRAGTRVYRLEGRLNGATSASVRFTSVSLFRLDQV